MEAQQELIHERGDVPVQEGDFTLDKLEVEEYTTEEAAEVVGISVDEIETRLQEIAHEAGVDETAIVYVRLEIKELVGGEGLYMLVNDDDWQLFDSVAISRT